MLRTFSESVAEDYLSEIVREHCTEASAVTAAQIITYLPSRQPLSASNSCSAAVLNMHLANFNIFEN